MLLPVAVRWLAVAVAVLVVAGGAGSAQATLFVYEPFDYPAGTVLDGTPATGMNLTGSWVALGVIPQQKLVTSAPGLGYGSLVGAPAVAGQRLNDVDGVTSSGGTVDIDQDVLIPPGSALYFSALFTFDDSSNGNRHAMITLRDDDTGDLLSFGEPLIGVRAVQVGAGTAALGGFVGDAADGAFENGQTLLLIGRYVNAAPAGGDRLELIGYDTAAAGVLPASFDPTDPQREFHFLVDEVDIDLAKISSITFTIRGDDNNFVDELRIGDSYASVLVPEPGSLSLLLLGLVMGARRPTGRAGTLRR
jgi:hypothetical protein